MSPQKALEAIGINLQKQYERWQPRARYKQTLDPTADEVTYISLFFFYVIVDFICHSIIDQESYINSAKKCQR